MCWKRMVRPAQMRMTGKNRLVEINANLAGAVLTAPAIPVAGAQRM